MRHRLAAIEPLEMWPKSVPALNPSLFPKSVETDEEDPERPQERRLHEKVGSWGLDHNLTRGIAFNRPAVEAPGRVAEDRHDDRETEKEQQRADDESRCDDQAP